MLRFDLGDGPEMVLFYLFSFFIALFLLSKIIHNILHYTVAAVIIQISPLNKGHLFYSILF